MKSIYTLLLLLAFCHTSCAQWDWDSHHIDQKRDLDAALAVIEQAYEGYALLEHPERIQQPPFDPDAVEQAYQNIHKWSKDDIAVTSEQKYLGAIADINNKINRRYDRIDYHMRQVLLKSVQAGQADAVKTASHIIDWQFLQLPVILETENAQRFQNLQQQLKKAL